MQGAIVVFGSINFDYTMGVERLPCVGESIPSRSLVLGTGGKGANQALQAARLGAQTHMLGRVGRDFMGDAQLESLAQSGVDTRRILRTDGLPTGSAFIIVDDAGRNMIVVDYGANARCAPEDLAGSEALFRPENLLVVQLEIPDAAILAAMERAKAAGMRIVLDPAPLRDMPGEFLALADIVKPNETEAAYHSGIPFDEHDIGGWARRAAQALRERGARNVVVTLGHRGCYALGESGEIRLGAYPIEAKDTTAAGDSFSGALAFALLEGRALPEALRFASAAGARTASRHGAAVSIPDARELRAFMDDHKIGEPLWLQQ